LREQRPYRKFQTLVRFFFNHQLFNNMKSTLFTALFTLAGLALQAQSDSEHASEIFAWRKTHLGDLLNNPRTPITPDDISNLRFYDPDAHYRLACKFERTPDEKPFDVPTSSGITKSFVKYGVLTFEWEGKKHKLAVYQNLTSRNVPGYANHLFLPFRDLTSGEETYGGGRYIDLEVADVEKESPILDFNKCYNPWCSYSEGYSCPIPPQENTLEIAIEAGEKMYAGEKKHK